jgi:two-component system nitrogen regulation sensor histidine kinase GlnL
MPEPGRDEAREPTAAQWLDALPEAFFGVDREGRICFANAAAHELLADAGVAPSRLADLFGDRSLLMDLLERTRRDTGIVNCDAEAPSLRQAGIGVSANALGDGQHVALSLRRVQAARGDESTRTRAMRTFSHELRNPLAGIRAAAQLIGRDAPADQAQLAALICEEVDRLRRLTERFDPLADTEPPRLRALNVHEPLAHVRKLVGSIAPSVRIMERYDPSLPPILGDFDQLVQAFLNVAKNAIDALADQKEPRLTIATAYKPGIKVKPADTADACPQLEVSFIDNGPGVAPEISERMFEAFVTTKEAGIGLGLSIASTIVARHGGAIEADSRPGRTEFLISLPIRQERSP